MVIKKIFAFPLILIIISAIISSCQIERKRYSNGYSVFSSGKVDYVDESDVPGDSLATDSEFVPAVEYAYNDIGISNNNESYDFEDENVLEVEQSADIFHSNKPLTKSLNILKKTEHGSDDPVRRTHPLGLTSFLCALLGIVVALFSFSAFMVALFLVLFLTSILFGILALSKMNKNQGVYKNKWMPIFGISISGLFLFFFIWAMIYFLILW